MQRQFFIQSQRSCGKMADYEVQKLTDECLVDGRASRRMIHVTAQKLTMKNYNGLKIGLGLLNIRSIVPKYEMVCDIIRGELDILVLIETWHGSSDEFAVRCAMPPGYKFVDYVRPHDLYHGGIIIYFKKEFIYKPVELPTVITFEAVAIKLRVNKSDFILLSIYRPGSVPPSPSFFSELANVLEDFSLLSDKIVVAGDFNVHMERKDDPNTVSFNDVFDCFQLINRINEPTHELGATPTPAAISLKLQQPVATATSQMTSQTGSQMGSETNLRGIQPCWLSCVRYFEDFLETSSLQKKHLLEGQDVEVIRSLCSGLKKSLHCLAELRKVCSADDFDEIFWKMKDFRNLVNFCSLKNIFEDYALSQTCLRTQSAQSTTCYDEFLQETGGDTEDVGESVEKDDDDDDDKDDDEGDDGDDVADGGYNGYSYHSSDSPDVGEYCRHAITFEKCLDDHVTTKCGQTSAPIVSALADLVVRRSSQCKFYNATSGFFVYNNSFENYENHNGIDGPETNAAKLSRRVMTDKSVKSASVLTSVNLSAPPFCCYLIVKIFNIIFGELFHFY
ncbi:hypothetical protein HELRODRAFT_183798 [Helobdella robusta]|uniref:Endonuclease/exonuclease/phosphatase domain-containing protein n=1 Tax=Helobdella robusta TaxID=6412 RepID=T1FK75_HELRO|nr:hypothetical protein HELRODRAFT_183798 [Helobdella robusta]ESO10273.1 hypothetical protein HELRODRAFT_183798 [Helobdella robusta]